MGDIADAHIDEMMEQEAARGTGAMIDPERDPQVPDAVKGKPHKNEDVRYGIRLAASVADEYNGCTSHTYKLGDCILSKLNLLPKEKIRPNTRCLQLPAVDVEKLKAFVQNVADNYDCDADAHRYGTPCRVCWAKAVLDQHLHAEGGGE